MCLSAAIRLFLLIPPFPAQAALRRYRSLSDSYQKLRKEIARLKTEASKVKKEMRKARGDAEDQLVRDELLEAEEAIAACNVGRGDIVAPSGLEFDFGDDPFPELGGGPLTFWGGSFADDTSGEAPDQNG